MKHVSVLAAVCLFLGISMLIGSAQNKKLRQTSNTRPTTVPYIGSIEIRNGCGMEGAANKVADFLRYNNFDVKFVGNAETWNYPYTIVVSRSKDTAVATQVAAALKTDKIVLMRNNENLYDVTVFIGPDFGERIQ